MLCFDVLSRRFMLLLCCDASWCSAAAVLPFGLVLRRFYSFDADMPLFPHAAMSLVGSSHGTFVVLTLRFRTGNA